MNYRNRPLLDRLAAEYVLGTLTGPARRRFERLLHELPEAQSGVDWWSARLDTLGTSLPAVTPPARVWHGIQRRLGMTATTLPGWHRLWLWQGAAALGGLATVVLAVYIGLLAPPVDRLPEQAPPGYVAVINDEATRAAWLLSFDVAAQKLRVQALAGQTLASEKSFELWLLPGQNRAPQSLGLLPANGSAILVATGLDPAVLEQADGVAVSLEPRGGSTTGAPTGPILYQGAIRKI